ncbi:hypothetical protein A2U01_0013078, partial [Trifolium medium]|nr:hypothetical protein [Trifolium medium]
SEGFSIIECGEYGHRIELCPKQNQTDVENLPAAKEVLPTKDATSQETSQEESATRSA